jgi:calcium-dependent protein kinase
LVQELCLGGELFDRLDEQPDYHYSEAQCARLVKQMLCAVRYIHSKGIVHRDLKLENFLFSNTSSESELKMIDFGLSKHFDRGEVHKEAVGTPYTVAPEVIKGSYDEKCDVWAIGVITYLLLSGDPPFGGCGGPEPLVAVRQNILSGKFKFEPEDIWVSVSPQAKDFICKCLVTDPRTRPTAAESQKDHWIKEWVKRHRRERDGLDGGGGKLNPNVVNALVNFKNYSDMRKLLCEVLSFTLLPDQIAGLRGEFEKMDTDGSGEISLQALKQVLLENAGAGSLGALTEEEVEDIFNAMRVRKDEPTIQWHEFIAAGLSQCKVDDRNLKLAFDRLDSDHKNYISLADMMDLMGNAYSETALKEMFQDTLNLGSTEEARITYDDFLRLMKGQAPKRRVQTVLQQVGTKTICTPSSTSSPDSPFLGAGQQNPSILANVAATAAANQLQVSQQGGSTSTPSAAAALITPTPQLAISSNSIPLMPSLTSSQSLVEGDQQQLGLTAENLHQNPDTETTTKTMVLEPGSLPGGVVQVVVAPGGLPLPVLGPDHVGLDAGVGTGTGTVSPLMPLSSGATGSLRGVVLGVGGLVPLAVVQENEDDATMTSAGTSMSRTKLSMVGSPLSEADLDFDIDMVDTLPSKTFSDVNEDEHANEEADAVQQQQNVCVSKTGADLVVGTDTDEVTRLPSQPSLTAPYSFNDSSSLTAHPVRNPSSSLPSIQVGNLNQSMMVLDDQKESERAHQHSRTNSYQKSNSGPLTFEEDDELLVGLENLDVNGGDLDDNNEIVLTSNVGAAIKRLSVSGPPMQSDTGYVGGANGNVLSQQLTASEFVKVMNNSTGHINTDEVPQTPPQPTRKHMFTNASPSPTSLGGSLKSSPRLNISPLSTSLYSRHRSKSVDEGDGSARLLAVQTQASMCTLTKHPTSPFPESPTSMEEGDSGSGADISAVAIPAVTGAVLLGEGDNTHLSELDASSDSVTGRLIKDANAPALQVNRELYRAHRRMRLGVLEASKQFEEERFKRARRMATQESMRNSANSQHRSRAGLVMKHGNTRLISTEEIRQMLENEEKKLEEKVEAVVKRTGRAFRGQGTGPKRHRKKTVSDMSGMFG